MPRMAFDIASVLVFNGADSVKFIDGLSSNKLDFENNVVINTLVLNNKAKILAQLHVFYLNNMLIAVAITDDKVRFIDYINNKILGQDVSISDVTQLNHIDLIYDVDIPEQQVITNDKTTSVTINDNYILEIYSTIIERKTITNNITAFTDWRIANMIPWYGYEISGKVNPYQCGLNNQVHENKGCYTGQEILTRMRTRGKAILYLKKIPNSMIKDEKISSYGSEMSLFLSRNQ